MISIELSSIPDIVVQSIDSAHKKAQQQRTANTWQQRTNFEKFSDLFPGDLAKNVVGTYLSTTLNVPVVNYDNVRTDGFANPDQYDLQVASSMIEVKASIEKDLTDIDAVWRRRRVIVYADLQHINDFVFQVYFLGASGDHTFCRDIERLRGAELQRTYRIQSAEEFARLFCAKVGWAHIMGFADKALAAQYVRERRFFRFRGKTGREIPRNYLDLFIRECYPPEQFAAMVAQLRHS